MKRYITYLTIAIATMLMAASCEKDAVNLHSDDEGGFSLDLKINSIELETRALLTEDQVTGLNPKVNIYMPNFEGLIRSYSYTSMPKIIYLPAGEDYRVDVVAGEAAAASPRKANFENKSYAGSSNFNIEAGKTSNAVAVTAKISNAITKVSFEESIANNFNEGYTLTVAVNKEDLASLDTDYKKLVYNASNVASDTQSGEGYFIIEDIEEENTVYWNFKGTLNKDGSNFSASGSFKATTDSDNDGKMDLVAARQNMVFRYDIKDGTLKFGITHETSTDSQDDIIIWDPKSTGLSTPKYYDIWATHLTISADVDAGQYSGAKFQYRKKETTQWNDAPTATKNTDGTYSTKVTGLNSSTTYEFRLLCTPTAGGEDVVIGASDTNTDGNIKEVITASTTQLPNSSFEQNQQINNVWEFYGSGEDAWWDSGNQTDVPIYGNVQVTTRDSDVPATTIDGYYDIGSNTYSVKMDSDAPGGVFAAGNIYSGLYGITRTNLANPSGTVYFGRPWDDGNGGARPTALKLYVKYTSSTIDKNATGIPESGFSSDSYDQAQIKIAIGTWDYEKYGGRSENPILVDTANKEEIIDYEKDGINGGGTIAYGNAIIDGEAKTAGNDVYINGVKSSKNYSQWGVITVPLVYYRINELPTHIVISCASSRFGDYFAGSTTSCLRIDGLQLIYDDNIVEYTPPATE